MAVSEVEATSELNFKYKIDLTSLMDSCRVCMAQNLNMTSIFETEKDSTVDEIYFCTGITIKQEAGLPTKICNGCLNNLSVAFKFKTSCLIADETFRKIASALKIKSEDPEEPDVGDVEYEDIVDCKDEGDDDLKEEVKQEPEEVEFCGVRKSTLIKVKKRFACDICHAHFSRRCYWKKHLLRQHDIVTPPQRPGRQKINVVIDALTTTNEFYARGQSKTL
ncbi:hypothetical protein B5X24_HaOG212114 [Helicoverpa armigera]|uniref:ZAD domain-containing protein n=1 Tax=Helicoverpa armigera TaxID=29058 RepID=A0A2W1B7X4_HELAM|nr:hypothetical protein B5X24_HaOG212114 [Helicoverpa armigera]